MQQLMRGPGGAAPPGSAPPEGAQPGPEEGEDAAPSVPPDEGGPGRR
jgi:hypothetical protein